MSDINVPKEMYRSRTQRMKDKVVDEIAELYRPLIDPFCMKLVHDEMKKKVREVLNKHFFRTYDT